MSVLIHGTRALRFAMPLLHDTFNRPQGARGRLILAGAIMLGVAALPPYGYSVTLRLLIAWSAGVAVYLALVWRLILRADATATQEFSVRDDPARWAIELILILASLASLVGVFFALVEAARAHTAATYAETALAILSATLAWVLTHTVYAMHYARLYYHDDEGEPTGGMDFHCDEPPDYRDFCYYAFAVATTFGATDVVLTGKHMRRTTVVHSLLSFALATINLSLALNVVTSLIGAK